jgi:hypothetical protein
MNIYLKELVPQMFLGSTSTSVYSYLYFIHIYWSISIDFYKTSLRTLSIMARAPDGNS